MRRPLKPPLAFYLVVGITLTLTIGYVFTKDAMMRHGWWFVIFIETIFGDWVGYT